ncbi:PREDICTED: interleukin-17F [Chrysochloris asiatica]|uniref:Interleukin-17F n=1 Tax=Chrysochloris asiatica TaxID=185453 RepID=A0A9B0T869_CHRAS|nr:PREDICTED: interleukin-17F [Chrysochloris asiatica]
MTAVSRECLREFTNTTIKEGALVRSLLMMMLGLILLRAVAAWKIPKAGDAASQTSKNCPSPEESTVTLDISSLNKNQGNSISSNINNRSTSPWDYSITEDPGRFPSPISEARCRSLSCINADGKPNNFMNSVPIHQEILVLRREARSCSLFRLEKIQITVGCTCVTPLVHHVV